MVDISDNVWFFWCTMALGFCLGFVFAVYSTGILAINRKSDLEPKVRKILEGIDREDDKPGGWWETSTGAQFGQAKLNEVVKAIR